MPGVDSESFRASRLRRLSSLDATAKKYGHLHMALPPRSLNRPTKDLPLDSPIHLADPLLDQGLASTGGMANGEVPLATPSIGTTSEDFALAFDIDGVLIRGGTAIPEAIEAMKYINGENPYGIRVPYIFLTNGGGKSEQERCDDLSRQLQSNVVPGQFICGHTPMREMAEKYNTVLVIGGEGEKCRIVAEAYGFKNVITPGDIIKTKPDTAPFRKLTEEEWNNSRTLDLENLQIEAVFVFADSRDWASDQQIILDVLMTKEGRLGHRSEVFNEGPPLYFSHNDVVWSTSHEYTRIGMGALRASVEALYKAVTGVELNTFAFGKPQIGTFQFATRFLQQWRSVSHGIDKPPATVYFFGDTPESDIRGTNEYNKVAENEWFSVLVKTGVYQSGTPSYRPNHICENILEGVKFAIEREHRKTKERGSLAGTEKKQNEENQPDGAEAQA
ncbi:phosphatase [Penicillium chermesinum]|uniref:Phosphatase n=1 Tax=Penicillium chermesinum TaxID=63820 RepID=A0A9W9PBG9_9EURO|nr:phosphatase [Penicillium chermesinum]KAJ5240178.1 phosphatase [Penicillium chermesinum]